MATTKEIFDKAILIKEGSTFLVPCHNKGHMESTRVMLSRQRKTFLETVSAPYDILISRYVKGDKFFVSLQKVPRLSTGMIIDADGSVEAVDLEERSPVEDFVSTAVESERIRAKMLEDGYSEEEINKYLGIEPVCDNPVEGNLEDD